ncbi:glycerol-3-phosphate responsive antiterminator (mRNA-binding) [Halobacteroides halobius DSM 5150]|uniref:Glycerol-3-phosphate responsive antiterminator (MRNA-binding) n=1 Tax=Halobacteroides halobius (strain ATCC 35273 / DSM 5150 / MD-1) TaxID=748449 RepID=L0KC48_HALHC|nr:glycerol-3-phosphate responsive antiterminator [Halobacteroides halobius]AGB41944.1 glycerol-3-phosphate responsive antiterminator (mRNA-binding) [Halobacteroides halobius DSM 5150]
MYIEYILEQKPIIAAIKSKKDLKKLPKNKIDVLFILRSKLSNLAEIVAKAQKLDVLIFLHIDMVKGIGNDKEAIRYLAREIGVDGVMTTKSYLIKAAKKEDLITIQRLFLLDSESLKTGINIIKNSKPDLIEVLPGLVVPELIEDLRAKTKIPIIAGGLVKKKEQVEEILNYDVLGISTSKEKLWKQEF